MTLNDIVILLLVSSFIIAVVVPTIDLFYVKYEQHKEEKRIQDIMSKPLEERTYEEILETTPEYLI